MACGAQTGLLSAVPSVVHARQRVQVGMLRVIVAAGAGAVGAMDIAILVNVEAVFGIGGQAGDVGVDFHAECDIREANDPFNVMALCGTQDAYRMMNIAEGGGGLHRRATTK